MLDRAKFVGSVAALREAHGRRLADLVGSELSATWVAWDASDDAWFKDEAVVLAFGKVHLEIVWWKFDEVAISWNQIDLQARPSWVSDWQAPFELAWRQDACPELLAVLGQRLTRVAVVEYRFETTLVASKNPLSARPMGGCWMLNGLEFQFGNRYLSVHNGLDENALGSDPVEAHREKSRRVLL